MSQLEIMPKTSNFTISFSYSEKSGNFGKGEIEEDVDDIITSFAFFKRSIQCFYEKCNEISGKVSQFDNLMYKHKVQKCLLVSIFAGRIIIKVENNSC